MNKLPIGIQDFAKLRREGYVYVDKTKIIYNIITKGYPYFFSRPRRFGKSLLISTLEYLFNGERELFKGLWIDKSDYDFQPHPVIRFDMSALNTQSCELLTRSLFRVTNDIANNHNMTLSGDTPADYLSKLITSLAKEKQVVVLVDEYDKPLLDNLVNNTLCQEIRDVLRDFYAVLKTNDKYIKLIFLTGVTKFSKVSIFSGLNNLEDISLSAKQSTLLGYTKEEIAYYFPQEVKALMSLHSKTKEEINELIKHWYNGYQFSEQAIPVYNPFSVLMLLKQQQFRPHWFATGTPSFLLQLIKRRQFDLKQLESIETTLDSFNTLEIEQMHLLPLLYQTGYLTIKHFDPQFHTYTLGYPNHEVQYAFGNHLLCYFVGDSESSTFIVKIARALKNKKFEDFTLCIQHLLTYIPYDLYLKQEKHYQSLLFLILTMVGLQINAEVKTNIGRADLIIELDNEIYIIETKLNQSAKVALQQIKSKAYMKKYTLDKKSVFLVGVNFDSHQKNVDEILVEAYNLK